MRLALVGYPGSGKTSIAEELVKRYDFVRLSFAGALKDEVAEMLTRYSLIYSYNSEKMSIEKYNRTLKTYREELDDVNKKERYRTLLQWWGTEFRRYQDTDYWVKQMSRAIGEQYIEQNIVVDDCRYFNEYGCLAAFGFKFVLLDAGETTIFDVPVHASEVDWKEFDFDWRLSYERGPEIQAERLYKMMTRETETSDTYQA